MTYGEKQRAEFQEKFKALNRRESRAHQFWREWSGDIGLFLWMVVGLMIGAGAWWLWGGWPR